MVIIAGNIHLRPEDRDRWVEAHLEIMKLARSQPGCVGLYLCADPVDAGRVNLFELWETEEELEAWRAVAEPPPKPEILSGNVQKHLISSSGPPFRAHDERTCPSSEQARRDADDECQTV
jgi:heme-degrading monooxygenase HmoA